MIGYMFAVFGVNMAACVVIFLVNAAIQAILRGTKSALLTLLWILCMWTLGTFAYHYADVLLFQWFGSVYLLR